MVAHWKVKGKTYPQRQDAVQWVEATLSPKMKNPPGTARRLDLSAEERAWRDEKNAERRLRRARRRMREKVRARELTRMGTLTYAENVQCREQVKADFERFARLMRRWLGQKQFRYVAVTERQKRGAWHIHFLTDRYLPQNTVARLWGHGWVSMNKVPHVNAACNYLVKYLAKGAADLSPHENLYWCSNGLLDVLVEWCQEFEHYEDAVSLLFALVGAEGYYWQAEEEPYWYVNNFSQ